MRGGKSRRSWRRSKDQTRQERRAAGKAGARGYEVLPVTAARTGTSKQSGCQPILTPGVLEAKAFHKPVSKASPSSRIPAGALLAEERQDLVHILWGCTTTTAPVPSGEVREGINEVMCFFLNRFKINTHHSNNLSTYPRLPVS